MKFYADKLAFCIFFLDGTKVEFTDAVTTHLGNRRIAHKCFFYTEDEELIERLKEHSLFGKDFFAMRFFANFYPSIPPGSIY